MSSVALSLILEKISSRDKDFRYMATSDLANELEKPSFSFESSTTENTVTTVVLGQLDDQSGDISSLANKCLGLLARKVGTERLASMASNLVTRMTSAKKDQERDVASLGLKTVITEVDSSRAGGMAAACAPPLVAGLRSDASDVASNCLDALVEIAARHASALPNPEELVAALLPELDESRAGIKKRAIQCLALLATSLPPASLDDLCGDILSRLEAKDRKKSQRQTYVQTLGALSRSIGYKLGPHLDRAVPLVLKQLSIAEEGDDELMEFCLSALEAFVQRSPGDARPFLKEITDACLKYIKYDPNYAADDEDEMQDDNGDEEDEEEEEEPYSDDEDTSWKVRRAAAKLAAAIVGQYTDVLAEVYRRLGLALVARFKEREEAVRPDIYAAYTELVSAVGGAVRRGDSAAADALSADIPAVLRALARQLRSRSPKTRASALKTLQQLVRAVPAPVVERAHDVLAGVIAALTDTSSSASSLKSEALHFVNVALASAPPQAFQALAPSLAPPIYAAAGERYYAVASEGLRACERLVSVLRPDPPAPISPELAQLVHPLFDAATAKLAAQDQSQEVKDAAISCVAAAVASLGDALGGNASQVGSLAEDFAAMPNKKAGGRASKRAKGAAGQPVPSLASASDQISEVLSVLVERLRNEITRLTTVKGLATVARSPLPMDLSEILPQALPELTSFLRQANRQLRLAALSAVTAIVARDGPRIDHAVLESAVGEAALLVTDSDLAVAASALRLLETVVREQTRAAETVSKRVLDPAVGLVKSPLLQGSVLEALQALLVALAASGAPSASFDALLGRLLTDATAADAAPAAPLHAARCVAALCRKSGQAAVESTVRELLARLEDASASDAVRRFSLACLGALGRESDLTAFPALPQTLTAALSSEAVAEAASLALGGVAAGNLPAFLPLVLAQIEAAAANPKLQYQLLRALNEVITTIAARSGGTETKPPAQQVGHHGMSPQQVGQVLALLLQSSSEEEEECRAVVAECLGHLALVAPEETLPALRSQLEADAPEARAVALAALKHATVDRDHPIDAQLATLLPTFLAKAGDSHVGVRRAAVQLLSASAHNKPSLVSPTLPDILPLLFEATKPDPSLVRTVNLGPFKHQIDDGLELRKAAYVAVGVLMSRCYDRLDPAMVLETLVTGLKDHYDVKMRCFGLLVMLADLAPGAVTASLDRLVEPLTATLATKVKQDAVKQEVDRNEDLLRGCLRAIDALARLPGAAGVATFKGMVDTNVNTGPMKVRYEAVIAERKAAEGGRGVGSGGGAGPEAMDMS